MSSNCDEEQFFLSFFFFLHHLDEVLLFSLLASWEELSFSDQCPPAVLSSALLFTDYWITFIATSSILQFPQLKVSKTPGWRVSSLKEKSSNQEYITFTFPKTVEERSLHTRMLHSETGALPCEIRFTLSGRESDRYKVGSASLQHESLRKDNFVRARSMVSCKIEEAVVFAWFHNLRKLL